MKVKVPHTLALLFFLMSAAHIITRIVLSRHFESVQNEALELLFVMMKAFAVTSATPVTAEE